MTLWKWFKHLFKEAPALIGVARCLKEGHHFNLLDITVVETRTRNIENKTLYRERVRFWCSNCLTVETTYLFFTPEEIESFKRAYRGA